MSVPLELADVGPAAHRPSANAISVAVAAVLVDRPTAAAALGMSLSHFERHVQADLRLVYSGRLRLVPVRELERWATEQAVGGRAVRSEGFRRGA